MFDRKAYMHRWYESVVKKRRQKWLKENGPCVDCGSRRKLQTDHVDPSKKISHSVWTWSEKRRQRELKKCRVRCLRCHAAKTRRENIERDIWKGRRKKLARGKIQCSACHQFLSRKAFHKDVHAANGVYPACKNCRRKYPSRRWKGRINMAP